VIGGRALAGRPWGRGGRAAFGFNARRYSRREMVALYVESGYSLRMIAGTLGCGVETVREGLIAEGVTLRPPHVTRRAKRYRGLRAKDGSGGET
jgi:transposase-like protein